MAKDKKAERTPKAPKAKREPKRKPHPAVLALGELDKLEAIPADYDFEAHAPIKSKTFKDKALYFDYKAMELDLKAKRMRHSAEMERQFGNKSERQLATRLQKMAAKMTEITAALTAQGIDVGAILAAAGKK